MAYSGEHGKVESLGGIVKGLREEVERLGRRRDRDRRREEDSCASRGSAEGGVGVGGGGVAGVGVGGVAGRIEAMGGKSSVGGGVKAPGTCAKPFFSVKEMLQKRRA